MDVQSRGARVIIIIITIIVSIDKQIHTVLLYDRRQASAPLPRLSPLS